MAAKTVEGYVTVYESSDGGSGDPAKTFWQFFVDGQPVTTANRDLAETARLAIATSSRVRASYDDEAANALAQLRLEFQYDCEATRRAVCNPREPTRSRS